MAPYMTLETVGPEQRLTYLRLLAFDALHLLEGFVQGEGTLV
jgi:hypothetical protein